MYTIYVKYECLPAKRETYLNWIKDSGILAAIRAEDGCVRYEYYLAQENPNELLLVEQWESKQHQQVHMTQPHMATLKEHKADYIVSTVLGEIELK